jgi:pimeloyl-ACP methyl ester carboxylesterase
MKYTTMNNFKVIDKSNGTKKIFSPPLSLRVVQLFFRIVSNIVPIMTTNFILKRFYKPSFALEKRRRKNSKINSIQIHSKDFYITSEEYKIHVLQFGKGNKVLLSHGWGGNGMSFHKFISPLVNSGFQPIAIDFPAHGSSSGIETSMFDFINTIDLICKKLGPFHAIIGHSVGGLATLNYLSKNHTINKAILISSPASIDTILSYYKRLFSLSDKVTEGIKLDISRRFHIQFSEISIHKLHLSIKTPTMIFHDKYDFQIPYTDGKLIAQKMQNTQFVLTKGLGHYRIIKDRSVISESLHFLKN